MCYNENILYKRNRTFPSPIESNQEGWLLNSVAVTHFYYIRLVELSGHHLYLDHESLYLASVYSFVFIKILTIRLIYRISISPRQSTCIKPFTQHHNPFLSLSLSVCESFPISCNCSLVFYDYVVFIQLCWRGMIKI